jgi:hypothetical protein
VQYQGRLELTWTNKHQRLLALDDGSYRWLPPSDYRIAEVRLLHDAGTVGDVGSGQTRAGDNLLIRGDALNALTSLAELPEFAREYLGKVTLAYLDPPFNYPIHDDGREARWSAGPSTVEKWLAQDALTEGPEQRKIIWKRRPPPGAGPEEAKWVPYTS